MNIKNLFTGIVTNERADIARALIRQGMAQAVDPKELEMVAAPGELPYRIPKPGDFKIPEPKWLVDLHPRAAVHVIQMCLLNQFHYYSGPPEDANRSVVSGGQRQWLNGFNREIPKSILDEYARRWKDAPQHNDVPKYVYARPGDSDDKANERNAQEQQRYDEAVRTGSVPFTGRKGQ